MVFAHVPKQVPPTDVAKLRNRSPVRISEHLTFTQPRKRLLVWVHNFHFEQHQLSCNRLGNEWLSARTRQP